MQLTSYFVPVIFGAVLLYGTYKKKSPYLMHSWKGRKKI